MGVRWGDSGSEIPMRHRRVRTVRFSATNSNNIKKKKKKREKNNALSMDDFPTTCTHA